MIGERYRLLSPFIAAPRLQRMHAVLARRTRHLAIVCDRFYDPNNVAACARTSDAFGLQDFHVVTAPLTSPRGLRPSAPAVSLAADRWLSRVVHHDPEAAVEALVGAGYRLIVADADPDADTCRLDASTLALARPLALVFGAEREGLHPAYRAAADGAIAVPMRGFSQSLNVSVAVGIVVSRLRERLDAMLAPDVWRLPDELVKQLLDRWVYEDLDQADAILAELARRQ